MKLRRKQSHRQHAASRRNWHTLIVKGAATQLTQVAQEIGYSNEALRQLKHNLYAISLCVEVNWHKQRRIVK